MILIADSGAKKTDWRIVYESGTVKQVFTVGINPQYQDVNQLYQIVTNELLPQMETEPAAVIKYYSAGYSSSERNELLEEVLRRAFPQSEVKADHDMLMFLKLQHLSPEALQHYLYPNL
ncbi:hypothetical protein [Pontibacter beigongshangensis]|uniref:hypothetical protein n=1 Tax=Pontibacter beigongshangensis TaxID=2574733 RepID=UPI0016508017|nr:hypothetical protein [Pontibacter beigongshangensis]